MAILKTEGIVLKAFDFRETSRIATFFTRDYGKVSGVLKGIRKDARKFSSSLDRFSLNDIVYYQYRNSDLHLISQCDMKQFFCAVRQDLKKSVCAHYVLELVNAMMPSEQRNRRIYHLMLSFFESLGSADDVDQLVHMFQIKMLLYSGFRPQLDACILCRSKVLEKARFSTKEGGLICEQCEGKVDDAHDILPGTIASLLHIEKNEWSQCFKLRLTAPVKRELKYILNNFLLYHLGRRLKSARLLG